MRIIKLGIISIVVFTFLITGFSLFFPSNIRISKAIDINASKDTVLLQISNVENWKHWFPGVDSAELIIENGKVKGISTINKQQLIINEITDSTTHLQQKK